MIQTQRSTNTLEVFLLYVYNNDKEGNRYISNYSYGYILTVSVI